MVTEETFKHYRNKITYAQNREDLLLESFFFEKKDGFYVDVGGYDPDNDSVTKLFYLKGWKGINIEPQPAQYKKFVTRRPRDININAAIGDKPGLLKLRVYGSAGLSTLSNELKEQYITSSEATTKEFKDIEVKVVPLKDIFKKHKVSVIDFMKVDVEGFEMEVLRSNDWKHYRPQVLCIEAGVTHADARSFLKERKYKHVFNDGLNDYYVDTAGPFKQLDFIDHLLIRRGGGIRYEDYQNALSLFKTTKKLERELEQEKTASKKREEDLQTEIIHLHQLLDDRRALLRKSLKMYVPGAAKKSEKNK